MKWMSDQIRFFYGDKKHNTWPKLFVLHEGILYTEYLNHYHKTISRDVVGRNFNPKFYSWNGYQAIVEIDKETALKTKLIKQINWIAQYLETLKIKQIDWGMYPVQ
jgi:hypothetical protein